MNIRSNLSTRNGPGPRSRAAEYQEQGFVMIPGLFAADEIHRINESMIGMHARGGEPGFYQVRAADRAFSDDYHYVFEAGDPLLRFPRVEQPHNFMPEIRRLALDHRIFDVFEELLREPALFLSSMYFFKPPGARGQAFHQDNWYLKVRPYSCVAAWIACDRCSEENGAVKVVPGTHRMRIEDPDRSDATVSYSREMVRPPAEATAVLPILAPGDTLFFDGNLIHGSEPNRSINQFRRSLVCHYMPFSAQESTRYGHAPLDRFGNEVERALIT
jgi:phytanoyl-CoA hydroxylase